MLLNGNVKDLTNEAKALVEIAKLSANEQGIVANALLVLTGFQFVMSDQLKEIEDIECGLVALAPAKGEILKATLLELTRAGIVDFVSVQRLKIMVVSITKCNLFKLYQESFDRLFKLMLVMNTNFQQLSLGMTANNFANKEKEMVAESKAMKAAKELTSEQKNIVSKKLFELTGFKFEFKKYNHEELESKKASNDEGFVRTAPITGNYVEAKLEALNEVIKWTCFSSRTNQLQQKTWIVTACDYDKLVSLKPTSADTASKKTEGNAQENAASSLPSRVLS